MARKLFMHNCSKLSCRWTPVTGIWAVCVRHGICWKWPSLDFCQDDAAKLFSCMPDGSLLLLHPDWLQAIRSMTLACQRRNPQLAVATTVLQAKEQPSSIGSQVRQIDHSILHVHRWPFRPKGRCKSSTTRVRTATAAKVMCTCVYCHRYRFRCYVNGLETCPNENFYTFHVTV